MKTREIFSLTQQEPGFQQLYTVSPHVHPQVCIARTCVFSVAILGHSLNNCECTHLTKLGV